MKLPIFLFSAILLVAISSCKTSRRAQGGKLKPKTEKVLMKELLANSVKADWFAAKARITYKDEYSKESFTANIRIQKDSLIWMNFKKFSIEGGRALITKDSVFVIDRLNGEYVAADFDYVQKKYNLPVNFEGLQAILLGNPVFFSKETVASVDSSYYLLSQKTDSYVAKYWLDGDKFLLREFLVDDFRNQRTVSVVSSDYQKLEDKQNFSYVRRLNMNSPDLGAMEVEIEFSKVEVNVPQNVEFNIPEKYKRVE